jgi:glucose/arabinose dehydrogenase
MRSPFLPMGPFVLSVFLAATPACQCNEDRGETAVDDPGNEGAEPEASEVPDDGPAHVASLTAVDVAPGTRFVGPLDVVQAPGDRESLYIVEQPGRIRIVRGGRVLGEPFLDMRSRVDFGGERGLLGLAFHPEYEHNGRFFLYYTPADAKRIVLAEYARSGDEDDRADPSEVRRLLDPRDPRPNHNGGMITFGPDGRLYVGMGDGGGGCDRFGKIGHGQDLGVPFGKLHRLDVDADERGFAAAGNPFAEREGAMPQIWAYGLRNPWRFSFDRATGDLYIGDVGQDRYEEINVQPAGSDGGENYGWRDYEGFEPSTVSGCEPTGRVEDHTEPVMAYALDSQDEVIRDGCSVIGGHVYRGEAIPRLQGTYLYGDHCSDDVGSFRMRDGRAVDHARVKGLQGLGQGLSSIGVDLDGELYIAYLGSGEVKRIVDASDQGGR